MNTLLQAFRKSRSGATAIEYGLIAAFISIATIGVLPTLKTNLAAKFQTVSTDLAQ